MGAARKKPRRTPLPTTTTTNDEAHSFWSNAFAPIFPLAAKPSFSLKQDNQTIVPPSSASAATLPPAPAATHSPATAKPKLSKAAVHPRTPKKASTVQPDIADDDDDDNDSMPDLNSTSSDNSITPSRTPSHTSANTEYNLKQTKQSRPPNTTRTKPNPKPRQRLLRSKAPSPPIIESTARSITASYTITHLPYKSQAILWTCAILLAYIKGLWLLLWLLQCALWVAHTTVEGGQMVLDEWVVQLVLVVLGASLGVRWAGPWVAFRMAVGEGEWIVEV